MREIFEYELDNIDEVLEFLHAKEKMEDINKKRIRKLKRLRKEVGRNLIKKINNKYHYKLPDNIASIVREYCFEYGIEIFIEDLFEPDYYACTYFIKKFNVIVYFTKDGYIKIEL